MSRLGDWDWCLGYLLALGLGLALRAPDSVSGVEGPLVGAVLVAAHLAGQIGDDLLVDERVDVLAQLVEQEPVTDVALVGHQLDLLALGEAGAGAEQEVAELGTRHHGDPIDQRDAGQDAQDDEPEPEEHVDLLVDNIQRQHAQSVELLHVAGGTVFVEGTLGHLGKDPGHRIDALVRLHFGELEHIAAVGAELPIQEEVHEVDLTDDIHKVEGFAHEEAEGVEVVPVQVADEVVHEDLLAVILALLVHNGAVEVHDQHLEATALPGLPQVARHIEEDGLEEEDEAHPLVVLVVLHFVLALHVRAHTGLDHIPPGHAGQTLRHRERGVDPTVGVHHSQRNLVHDAVDRVTDILTRGDQQREGDQDDHRGLVVHPKHIVVDAHLVDLQQALDGPKDIKHLGGVSGLRLGLGLVTTTGMGILLQVLQATLLGSALLC